MTPLRVNALGKGMTVAALIGALAACGGGSSSAVSTVTATVTVAPTASTPDDPSSTTDTVTPELGTDDPVAPTETDTPGTGASVLEPTRSGSTLKLADFFKPDEEWVENRYDVADRKAVEGISTTIGRCGEANPEQLELRLANNFQQLAFNVAQANDSAGSDQSLTVEVVGNGKQIDVRRIPFNRVQNFKASVAGVNALQLRFYLDPDIQTCGQQSVAAVVFDVVLT